MNNNNIVIKNYGGATSQVKIRSKEIVDREGYILDTLKGKSVLHIGCCDAPYTKDRYNNGKLLFLKINEISNLQIGMDISTKNIDFLKSKDENFHIVNLNLEDKNNLIKFVKLLEENQFDYILMGEVIEHLFNYREFLKIIQEALIESECFDTELLITTPNFISINNVFSALKSREYVHPDHTYWPSIGTLYFTLSNMYNFEKCLYYSSRGGFKNGIINIFLRLFPLFSDGIILHLRVKNGE